MRPYVIDWLDRFLPGQAAWLLAPSWFTCVGLAGVATLLALLASASREPEPRIERAALANLVLWVYVAAVVAGIAIPMFIDLIEQHLAGDHIALHWAGMTSFWGYLAGFAALVVVCRDHDLPLARVGDIATAPAGAALVLARLGCFLAGCDYGKVTAAPWAMRFPKGSPAWHAHVDAGLISPMRGESLPVHPTQLYEALLGLAIIITALALARRPWAQARRGRVATVGIVIYAVGRIVVEVFRGDVGRGIHGGLSSGQIFSLCVLAALAMRWLATRRANAASVAAATTIAIIMLSGRAEAQPAQTPPAQPAYPPATYVAPPAHHSHVEVGVLAGLAMPVNRRPEQVATLGGPTLSAGYVRGSAGLWLDFDSLGNADASHGTWLLSGSIVLPVGAQLRLGGRAGIGTTLVNFDEAAFRDVRGTTYRVEAIVDYAIAESWAIWVRPLSLDVLAANELGGPITTWQMRVGIAYRIGARKQPSVVQPSAPPGPGSNPTPNPSPTPTPNPNPMSARIP